MTGRCPDKLCLETGNDHLPNGHIRVRGDWYFVITQGDPEEIIDFSSARLLYLPASLQRSELDLQLKITLQCPAAKFFLW